MFTGLIQTTAEIRQRRINGRAGKLALRPTVMLDKPVRGESIAVNGACLTLEKELSDGSLEFHVLAETFNRTNLGAAAIGSSVNLERALALGSRLGGHFVTGHIDATAGVIAIRRNADDIELEVAAPQSILPYLVEKGSIAIDGISLTLVDIKPASFSVRLIPVTWNETCLRDRKPGDMVNLEADLIGKYVRRQLGAFGGGSKVDADFLRRAGWAL